MSESRPKEDVLIHYDEESSEIVFFTVPARRAESLRSSALGGIRPTVDELHALDPTEAMRRVGGTVLALLDLSSKVKLGIGVSGGKKGNDEL